jgi:aspartate racemase
LLGCLSSADDVVFGTVLSGRLHGGELANRALGVYLNTLPVRVETGRGGMTECVRRTHTLLLGLLRHEQASLTLARKVTKVKPSLPLFGALLNLQEGRERDENVQQGCGRLLRFINQTNYPLVLDLDLSDEGLEVKIQSRGVMSAQQLIRYFVLTLRRLVESLESGSDAPLNALDIVPAKERESLLATVRGPKIPHDIDRCIHEVFDARAAETPDAVALVFRDRPLTYEALRERANRLANHLQDLGVGHETPVGLCLNRGLDCVVAMLAILKAGGAYVPLDPNYPKARLARMIDGARAGVIVTETALRNSLPDGAAHVVCVDADAARFSERSTNAAAPRECGGGSLACILFTSGSTGEPKGVCLEHRSLLRTVLDPEWLEISSSDTFLQYASISFDLAMVEIWGSLLNGATLIVGEPGQLSLKDLGRTIRDHGVTILCLSTALFHAMVDSELRALLRVKQFVVGGETLSRKHAHSCMEVVHPRRLINIYGPTESTVLATCMPITGVMNPKEVIPIGRPIGNTQVYILDEWLNLVPAGVTGEIFIGGDGLARGYLAPELTAEKFIANPFAPGNLLYRTGDLARHRHDGLIEFMGRRDTQVKLRGYRIELGEVEAVLARHDGVEKVVVEPRKSSRGDTYLAAYVVPKNGVVADEASWRDHVGRELPGYMCPSAYVVVDRFPLTPNGKVKRGALPEPKLAGDGEALLEPPRGPTETALAEIWCKSLGLPSVGRYQNFFDLGGHSILAAQIFSKVQTRLNVKASVLSIYRAPTIAELARELDSAPDGRAGVFDPKADFAEILQDMNRIVGTWTGARLGRRRLIVSENVGGAKRDLFWSFQAEHEMHELAKKLGAGQPLHAMRSGHLIMDYTDQSLPNLASHYADEVNQIQPQGPIVIGGNCQGAAVAYATANRLIEMGREIDLLIMLEQSRFRPFRGKVALIFGEESHINPFMSGQTSDAKLRAIYGDNHTVDFLPGQHGSYFREPGIDFLAEVLNRHLRSTQAVS